MAQDVGPIQLLAAGFDADARFEGRIIDELESLERHETIRILDLLFVGKDAETGHLLALDYQGEELGAIVGDLAKNRRAYSWSYAGRKSRYAGC